MKNSTNQTIMFLCEYKSLYGGNFVPSIMAIEDALKKKGVRCIYVFPEEASGRYWFRKMKDMGKELVTCTFRGTRVQKLKEIKGLVDKYQVSILHSHFGSIATVECLALMRPYLRVIIHIHSDFDAGKYEWKEKIRDFCLFRLLSGNVRFISVSKAFVARNPKKTKWVPNALADERIACEHVGGTYVRNLYGVKSEEILVLLFGWSPIVKGVDVAVNAVKQLNEQHGVSVKLAVVCGREMTPKKMQQWIEARTNCTGKEPYLCYLEPTEDVFSYHEAADILLSSSRSEGFSYAILEMLSLGKRCVISDIPGVSWAKEYETVVPYMTENEEACVQGILKAIKGIPNRSEETIIKIKQLYSIDKWVNEIIGEYRI